MNLTRLKQAEADFFYRYPGGFENPELIQIRKKHNLPKMFELAQGSFPMSNFQLPERIVANMISVITRSSLVSRFEKPAFRGFAHSLLPQERERLANGLEDLLHGDEQRGFETMLEILQRGRLAKWSLMTICQAYYHPQQAVFLKPTTTKEIINYFELDRLHYSPTPTWIFYQDYHAAIEEMKSQIDPALAPYNIAFTGFLMRSMKGRLR